MALVPASVSAWRSCEESLQAELTASLEALAGSVASCDESTDRLDLALRLPEVVRSNAHSMETASELRCYLDPYRGLSSLSGLSLYG